MWELPSGGANNGKTVTLTEHDEHLWADRDGQEKVSSAVRDALATRQDPYAESEYGHSGWTCGDLSVTLGEFGRGRPRVRHSTGRGRA